MRSGAASTFIVMGATALSAVLGFGREIISAHFYGTSAEMDAFLNASTIPTVLFGIFNGALAAALIPTFSESMSRNRPDEMRRLASTVINSLLLGMSALAAIGALLAPLYVPLIAHGFPPREQALVVVMVRWMMPGIVATCLSGVLGSVLNANRVFFASGLVWVATNVVTIFCVITLHRKLGIFALVLGSVAGLFAQLVLQAPTIIRNKWYQFTFDLRNPGIARVWSLLVPIAVGAGAGQINLAFDRYFASMLRAGSTSAIGYTTKLTFLPVFVVAGAISTVIFPMVARQFADDNLTGIRRSVSLALRMVTFVIIPSATVLSVLAFPIVQTLFQRGAFGLPATTLCASLVPFACIPLFALSYNTVLVQSCYACKEVRRAVTGSMTTVVINIILSATLLPTLGARGLLLSNGVAGLLLATYQVSLVRSVVGDLDWAALLNSFARVSLASLVMAGALGALLAIHFTPAPTLVSRGMYLLCLLIVAALVFCVAARLLRVEELSIALSRIRRKLTPSATVVGKPLESAG